MEERTIFLASVGLIFLFAALDTITTISLALDGAFELNPLIVLLLTFGPKTFFSVKMLLAAVAVAALSVSYIRDVKKTTLLRVCLVGVVASAFPVANNLTWMLLRWIYG